MDGHMEDLDALLADLQNTAGTSGRPLYSSVAVNGVNENNVDSHSDFSPPLPPPPASYSPTLKPKVRIGPAEQRAQLNANISELDNLLGDLEGDGKSGLNADNKSTTSGSGSSRNSVQTNGDTNQKAAESLFQQSNVLSTKVEALLDELDSAVAPTPPPVAPKPAAFTRPTPPRSNDLIIDTSGSPKTASSATKELDELMASLSDFKVNVQRDAREASFSGEAKPDERPVSSSRTADYAKIDKQSSTKGAKGQPGRTSQLDSMLGTLQSDMSRQGVTTVTKGTCAACKKPIVGQVCTALGRIWHPEHFTCAVCETPLGQKTFFERDGKPFCEEDYHEQFAPKCGYCEGPILDACVTAMDQTWHPEHFVCFQCGKAFGETGYHEKDGKPYCRDDYYGLFAPKCSGCNRAIMDNYISALNGHWHPQCFVCMECHQPFHGGSFFEHEGMPYCEMHYHARRGSLCYSCQKPITGRCITAMHRKFHPEHFICAFCLKQLNKGTFKEMNDKPYCHPCFVKLFG